jgi:indolepyruvate ferredoxin oxidoreductase beta subunit
VPAPASLERGERPVATALRPLRDEAARNFSGEARDVVMVALERLGDYQDAAYARDFLTRLKPIHDIEQRHGDGSGRLLVETARQLALAMAYEDTIRVAELKIRSNRFARVRAEAQIADEQILEIAEFFHPRTQEIADTLPALLGRWLMRTGWARALLDRATRKGRVVKTTSIAGFLLLYTLSQLKPLRRRSLRFATEQGALASWIALVADAAHADYALALAVARMRGLVKGYGDTHARGQMKFEKLTALLPQLRGRTDASALLERLIKAANADEEGQALDKAIADLDADVSPRRSARSFSSGGSRGDERS